MRLERITQAAILCLIFSNVPTALTHHSVSGNFDRNTPREIKGTLTAFHLRNPHTQLELDVMAESQVIAKWLVEWGTKNDLIRRGVDVGKIRVGDELRVTLLPSFRLEHVGYVVSLTLPDGSLIQDCGFRAFREVLLDPEVSECEVPER